MALRSEDIDEQQIASSKALLITGTHFSTEQVFKASSQALDYAEKHNVKRVLDIDYRPVLWGLTSKADGETRFVADQNVSQHVQSILPRFDLIVGTEEEFLIAGGSTDLLISLRDLKTVPSTPAFGCKCSMSWVPVMHSCPVTLRAGSRTQMTNAAARWPTPVVAWWFLAMPAHPRCPRQRNSITCSTAPYPLPDLTLTRYCSVCIGSACRAKSGSSCSSSPLIIGGSWWNWRKKPVATSAVSSSSSNCSFTPLSG